MLLAPEISDTVCVNLNDAIVWVAFRIFPRAYFEPLDKSTAELLKIIDCGHWVSGNNMYDKTVYTTEICRKYNLPENIAFNSHSVKNKIYFTKRLLHLYNNGIN